MKKKLSRKNKLIIFSILGISSAISISSLVTYFATKYHHRIENKITNDEFSRVEFKETEKYTNILDEQDSADINIYYSSYGVQTFYNLIRMAMLSKKSVIFYHSKNNVEIQQQLNTNELRKFLQNERNTDEIYLEDSKVIEVKGEENKFFEQAYYQAYLNPTKKVNVWFNSDHIASAGSYFEKIKNLKNVKLQAIEDSNVLGEYHIEHFYSQEEFKSKYYDFSKNEWKTNLGSYDRLTQYFRSAEMNNLKIYWSDKIVSNKYSILNFKNHLPFFENYNNLKDLIFTIRTKENKRFSSFWSKITGLDWEKERDKVNELKSKFNKPSLIILGSGYDEDFDYVMTIIAKLNSQYNIFYKGHPGVNKTSNELQKAIKSAKEISYYDYDQKVKRTLNTAKIQNFDILESQISSEELTTHHANEEKGLWFDKWFATDYSTSALFGLKNNKNNFEDLIGFVDLLSNKEDLIWSDEKEFTGKFESIVQKIAAKNIFATLKEESKNKDKSELKKEDFILTTSVNSSIVNLTIKSIEKANEQVKLQISFEYNPREVDNHNSYTVEIVYI
ncbi:hypothetical protein [Mycoplasma sp. 1012]